MSLNRSVYRHGRRRRSSGFPGSWIGLFLLLWTVLTAGCLSRTANPTLPDPDSDPASASASAYPSGPPAPSSPVASPPSFPVAPATDPGHPGAVNRVQEMQTELQKLREHVGRLQASGVDQAQLTPMHQRMAFLEQQLGMYAPRSQVQPPENQIAGATVPLGASPPAGQDTGAPYGSSGLASPGVQPSYPGGPRVEIANQPIPPEEQAWRDAYTAYKNGGFAEAVEKFEGFLTQYPQSQNASSARYWIGEALLAQGKFDEAVISFDRVIKEFPGSSKVPDALLKQGQSFEGMGDVKSARIIYSEKLMKEHPHSPQASKAKSRLKALHPQGPSAARGHE